ncbi:MAG: MBL fold metallo-hydrolase [Anaerolineae bacterium]
MQDPIRRIIVPAAGAAGPRNAWLLTDGPLTLVDPGPDTAAAYGAVRDSLARFGCSIRDIERLVLTHAHDGHAGLTARIHADSGARVLAHPGALEALRDPSAALERRVLNWSRAVKAAGVPPDRAARIVEGVRASLLEERAGASPAPPPAAAPLADGERLDGRARARRRGRSGTSAATARTTSR